MFRSLPALSSRLVGLALVATALVAAQATTTAEATTSGPMYGAPKVGTCYSVSFRTAMQDSTTAAAHSCRKAHTLWIVAVAQVPAGIDIASTKNNPALDTFTSKVCAQGFRRTFKQTGRAWGLSSYRTFGFVASKAQQEHGAHWITCEVGIAGGRDRLATTRVVKPARLSMHPKSLFRNCSTSTFDLTNCAARHAFRATYVQVVSGPVANWQSRSLAICRKHMRGHTWLYGARPLSDVKWVAVCSIKTRH